MAQPDESAPPPRTCEKCKAEMAHLSDWPSFLEKVAVRIFRCYTCDNVVSEAWSA
jgi:DNA-directed RNA polymerase subunit N (RpoN/RPB10)